MKSAAARAASLRLKGRITSRSMHEARIRRTFSSGVLIRGGAFSGASRRSGCGSKVMTAAAACPFAGAGYDAAEDLAVTEVHPVKVADGDHRTAGRGDQLRKTAAIFTDPSDGESL